VTKAALREMIFPALLPILAVLLVAATPMLGAKALGGVLVGTIITGLLCRHLADLFGWRVGQRQEVHRRGQLRRQGLACPCGQQSPATRSAILTRIPPPAINPMIKVVNIVAILIIPLFF